MSHVPQEIRPSKESGTHAGNPNNRWRLTQTLASSLWVGIGVTTLPGALTRPLTFSPLPLIRFAASVFAVAPCAR
jgi:hypothetical protein